MLDYVAGYAPRQRRRPARLPPRRPRLDAAGQGPGRLLPDRPRAGARLRVRSRPTSRSARILNGEVVQEGSRGRPDLADQLPAGRPVPHDHAAAGRRGAVGHPGQLAADAARRRRRGRGVRAGPADQPRGRLGRRPVRARASSCRCRPTRCTSPWPCPRTRPSERWSGGQRADPSCAASTTSACAWPTWHEATARWALQFGLTEERRGTAIARTCAAATSPTRWSWSRGDPGHDHTGWELRRGVAARGRRRASWTRRGVDHEQRDGSLHLADPDGNGIELMPFRDARRPPPRHRPHRRRRCPASGPASSATSTA